MKEDYFYRPNFLNYMLRIEGNPAAMRGCQLTLLKHRLSEAVKLGVKNVYTDVEFGSGSHGNMEKVGFKTAYLNTFWIKK